MELHPSITLPFIEYVCKSVYNNDTDDLASDYCDRHKDAYGIKARWVFSRTYTINEWLVMFSGLAYAIDAECEREEAEQKAFMERIASVGLTAWAKRNNIRSEYDLMEHNYMNEHRMLDRGEVR